MVLTMLCALASIAHASPPWSPPLGASLSTRRPGTEFRLWAPNAESVSVIGTFNGWDPSVDRMRKEDSGDWFGYSPAANPGDEYMFVIDGRLERRDPRAREVSASGKCVIQGASPSPSRLRTASTLRDLVIYQLHPGTFNDPSPSDGKPGTLDDAVLKLDHLRDLGVNCVLLMPVCEFPYDRSWGYNPSDIFAVEAAYGGPAALRRFIAECHRRDIAVHVDIVHNHYGPEGLDLWDFDTYGKTPPSPMSPSGIYFYSDPEMAQTPWGPRPDFGRREVRDFVSDQVRMWFDEYGVDGLRWDSTVNIRAYGPSAGVNPEGERMLDRVSRMIRREYPGKISIAEDSVGDPRFDASWERGFHHDESGGGVVSSLLLADPSATDMGDIARRLESYSGFDRVVYSESHDEVGLLNSKARLLTSADPENPLSTEARRTAALAAVLTLTCPSIPMIFMGQEMGATAPFHDDAPLDWNLSGEQESMLRVYADLVSLRRNLRGKTQSMQSPKIRVLMADESEKLLVFRRYVNSSPELDMVVAMNLSSSASKSPLPFPSQGKWHTVFSTGSGPYGLETPQIPAEVEADQSGKVGVSLPPRSAHIFSRSPLPTQLLPPPRPSDSSPQPPASPSPVAHEGSSGRPAPGGGEAAPPPPRPLYVCGNFTQPPWQEDRADLAMSPVEDNVWQIDLFFESASSLELRIVEPGTGLSFGDPRRVTVPAEGLMAPQAEPLSVEGNLRGDYRLTFNERSLRYRLERRAKTEIDRVNVVSSGSGWNRSANPMHMVDDYKWQADIEVEPSAPFEFVLSANGSLEEQWGSPSEPASPSEEWSGRAEKLGPPFRAMSPSGVTRISFDERTGELSFRPLPESEISPRLVPPPPVPQQETNHPASPGISPSSDPGPPPPRGGETGPVQAPPAVP